MVVGFAPNLPKEDANILEREKEEFPQRLLADYPLKPQELLSDITKRVFSELQQLARIFPDRSIWIVDKLGDVIVRKLHQIADPTATKKAERERLQQLIEEGTVLLPPDIGGLTNQGTLSGKEGYNPEHPQGYDVADLWLHEDGQPQESHLRQATETAACDFGAFKPFYCGLMMLMAVKRECQPYI